MAQARVQWDSERHLLAFWWSEKFKLPPNHQLFVGETLAYWKQWFYMDALRTRDHLRRDLAETRSTTPTSKEHQQGLDSELDVMIERINAINDVLREPHDEVIPGAEAEREAAAKGELPSSMGRYSVADAKAALMAKMGQAARPGGK